MDKNIGRELFILVNKMKRLLDKYQQRNGIYSSQARILTYLYRRQDEKTYQKDIEQAFQIRGGTVTGMLDGLIKLALIERLESQTDKRKRKIVLTRKGEEYALQAIETIKQFEDVLKADISIEQTKCFEEIINTLNKTIDEEETK